MSRKVNIDNLKDKRCQMTNENQDKELEVTNESDESNDVEIEKEGKNYIPLSTKSLLKVSQKVKI